MAERKQPRSAYEAQDFPGLTTAMDPTDLPPGASVLQTNVQSNHQGELASRPGCKRITFEEE